MKEDENVKDFLAIDNIQKKEVALEEETSKNEKLEEIERKTKKIGIKLPWWIGYTVLAIVFILFTFLICKAFNLKFPIETFSNMELSQFNISCDKQEIEIGEMLEIKINKYDNNVKLQSSNPEIINIINNSVIGVAEGETIIYATSGEKKSNEITLKCIVGLEEITINKTELELLIGKEEQLTAGLIPENATYKELIWKSSNEAIATVNNGLIKGIKEGEAIITVSNLQETKVTKCIVTVKPQEVKSVSLDETNVKLGVGQNYILKEIVNPSDATDPSITWDSSNIEIVTVDNGQIKAIGTGQAKVTIKSKNGKTATCTFNVGISKPSNTIKYVTNDFNVRIRPGTEYKLLGSVTKNDEIEILKETDSWTKLRMSNGVVGYTISKAYSSDKMYYINGVPYINQFNLGYPTGCEAVAATMAAQYAGYNISASTIVANTPTDNLGIRQEIKTKEIQTEVKKEVPVEKEIEQNVINEISGETEIVNTTITETKIVTEIQTTTQEENVWVGGNPFKVFVGHPTKSLSKGSYGCFAAPIVIALNNSGVSCTNISGSSIDTIFNYIQNGKPVIVWCKKNAGDLIEGVTWEYPDESGEFTELKGEHCALLIGYDGEYVYLNDPSAGKGVKQAKGKFISNWYKLYSQAIIIN